MKSLIRMSEVERRTTHSCSEIKRRVRDGTFPRPVRLSHRVIAWVEEEVDAYVESKIAARDERRGAIKSMVAESQKLKLP
jgi:prophage regulatory protein